MDDKQRTDAAKAQDGVTAGRIVRGIAQIESDFHLASGPLSEQLMGAASQAIAKVAQSPWLRLEDEMTIQVVAPEWKMTKGVGTGDAWLELAELCDDEDNEYSWVAAAVGAGPTRMCIELVFRRGLVEVAQGVLRDDKALTALWKLGFVRDETDLRLFVPIKIEAEKLAQGFEQNDLSEAMAPVGKALQLAIAAKTELDALIERVRDAAKRR